MGRNTYGNKKAVNRGVSIPSHNSPTTTMKTSGGKHVGASKAPLPKQKKSKGSGIAGRGTRG